jgi:Family of unknown function (DUF5723)
MFRFLLSLGAILSSFSILSAQDQLGLRLERYSGISSATINPANLSGMAMKWDVNLGGFGQFVETNYGFIANSSVPKVLLTPRDTSHFYITSLAPDATPPKKGQVVIDFEQRKRKFFGENRTLLMLPSFAFHLGKKNTVGFSVNGRADAMSHTLPASLGYPRYDAHPRNEEFKIGRMSVAGMAYLDAAAHFSHKTELENGSLAVAASLHILSGFEGGYARGDGSFFLTKIQGDSLIFRNTEFEGGVTNSNFGILNGEKPRVSPNGIGMGFDFGFVFTKHSDILDENDYPWKIGFSVLDIGRVNFRKNTERHAFISDSSFLIDPAEFKFFNDPNIPIRYVSQQANRDSLASYIGEKFSIRLPFAFSAQADFRVFDHIYMSGLLIQRVDFQKASLQRPNLLAVTPRYERRWMSVSMPFCLSEWQHVRLGLAARLGFLVIGTDHLNSFFQQKKLYGSDFYIALKINSFRFWGENAREKRRNGRRDRVKCYKFK